ncbi:MAG: hypothetical protein Q8R74_12925 [Methylophilus sp.]|nr:hypothetical protein [Methylophilus sp.]
MRENLRDIGENQWWIYGPSEEDFLFTMNLVKDFISANQAKLQKELDSLYERSDIDEQSACEVHDDLTHYAWINEQYLWQFCLWRLQGIFESIVISRIAPRQPEKPLFGMRSKINFMKGIGFELTQEEEDELLAWADLRNALSHAPPRTIQSWAVERR